MKILYLQQLLVLPGSSGNMRSFELARQWAQQGHEVSILCSHAAFPPEHPCIKAGKFPCRFRYEGLELLVVKVPYHHLMPFGRRVLAFLAFFFKAWRLGRTLKGYDLILAYSAPLSVGELGRRLARYHGIPWVFEIADVWPDVPIGMGIIRQPLLVRWLYRRAQLLYREACKIIVFSEGMLQQLLQHGVNPSKIEVIHNGVNTRAQPFVSRTALPQKPVQVLYAGTVGRANGVDQIVQVAHYLQAAGKQLLQFTILGNGNDLQRVKKLAARLQLQNLRFLHEVPQQQVAHILAGAHIGLVCFAPFPVLEANGATKFFDYLASGLPIVINYQGWQAHYLHAYQCGLSGQQGDTEAFARNILRLAEDPQLRQTFSQNGRKLAERMFDRSLIAQKTLAVMQSCVPDTN
ncbi:MAG: glycosyltransferase WbuB [Bacteroidetes bacterium]|nr:MAG: glycosyltransferase WbuB [Bacteroidota bacterium]